MDIVIRMDLSDPLPPKAIKINSKGVDDYPIENENPPKPPGTDDSGKEDDEEED
jgi:hypothetical protein